VPASAAYLTLIGPCHPPQLCHLLHLAKILIWGGQCLGGGTAETDWPCNSRWGVWIAGPFFSLQTAAVTSGGCYGKNDRPLELLVRNHMRRHHCCVEVRKRHRTMAGAGTGPRRDLLLVLLQR
jgi:hypothetical protein